MGNEYGCDRCGAEVPNGSGRFTKGTHERVCESCYREYADELLNQRNFMLVYPWPDIWAEEVQGIIYLLDALLDQVYDEIGEDD